jgi:hypothetical protein
LTGFSPRFDGGCDSGTIVKEKAKLNLAVQPFQAPKAQSESRPGYRSIASSRQSRLDALEPNGQSRPKRALRRERPQVEPHGKWRWLFAQSLCKACAHERKKNACHAMDAAILEEMGQSQNHAGGRGATHLS